MLVLTRRQGEGITIGDDVRVTVVEVQGDRVRLDVEAPAATGVYRQEVWAALSPEIGWLHGTDPERMLASLGVDADERKLRLFACACCRRIWHLIADPEGRRVIEAAERLADGGAAEADRAAAEEEVLALSDRYPAGACVAPARRALEAAVYATVADAHSGAPVSAREATAAVPGAAQAAERLAQCALLRDVFGNPYRPAAFAPAWRTWEGGTVVGLARAAHEERDPRHGTLDNVRLAVLADALEEAGCTDEDILRHLRDGGGHVAGCWVVDRLLARE
jgi:carbon storage regulator CsrA